MRNVKISEQKALEEKLANEKHMRMYYNMQTLTKER